MCYSADGFTIVTSFVDLTPRTCSRTAAPASLWSSCCTTCDRTSTSPCARAAGPAIAYSLGYLKQANQCRRLDTAIAALGAHRSCQHKKVVGRNTVEFNASGAISNQKRACTSRQVAGGQCVVPAGRIKGASVTIESRGMDRCSGLQVRTGNWIGSNFLTVSCR